MFTTLRPLRVSKTTHLIESRTIYRDIQILPIIKRHYPYKQYLCRTDTTTLLFGAAECGICFCDWINGDRVTQFFCNHSAHQQCIMDWEVSSGERKCYFCDAVYNQWPDHGIEHVHYYGGIQTYIKNTISSLLFTTVRCILYPFAFIAMVFVAIIGTICTMIRYIGSLFASVIMYGWDCICWVLFDLQGLNNESDTFDIDSDYIADKAKWYRDYAYSCN